MTEIARNRIVVHNKTSANISPWHQYFCDAASTGVLPVELADLFTISVEHVGDKVIVHVDFT